MTSDEKEARKQRIEIASLFLLAAGRTRVTESIFISVEGQVDEAIEIATLFVDKLDALP